MTTARLGLPFIVPGQAQKESAHNEALTLIDLMVQPAVNGGPRNAPPSSAEIGECWIVGATPTGVWTGHAGAIAGWTEGGWRFVQPRPGMIVWDTISQTCLRFATDGGWIAAETIRIPSGGSTVDTEARATLVQVVQALRQHGLAAG